jgi:hypothetical protein
VRSGIEQQLSPILPTHQTEASARCCLRVPPVLQFDDCKNQKLSDKTQEDMLRRRSWKVRNCTEPDHLLALRRARHWSEGGLPECRATACLFLPGSPAAAKHHRPAINQCRIVSVVFSTRNVRVAHDKTGERPGFDGAQSSAVQLVIVGGGVSCRSVETRSGWIDKVDRLIGTWMLAY